MDSKTNGEVTKSEDNETTKDGDVSGWIFLFFNDGFFKRGWKKRWCVLNGETIFLYDHQTTDNKDKNCGSIDLKHYHKCVQATKKECKKSPHGLVLEVAIPEEGKNKPAQKSKASIKKINKEIFYTESKDEKDRWLEKLNTAISIARLGGSKNLEHVTKSRAKPSGVKRRPPTRKHLRDVATQSQLLPGIDFEEAGKSEPTKRGHVPSSAIKPPPGAKKRPTSVPLTTMTETLEEDEEQETLEDVEPDKTSTPDAMKVIPEKVPVPSPRHKIVNNEEFTTEGETSSTKTSLTPPTKSPVNLPSPSPRLQSDKSPLTTPVKSHVPPPAPSKALKPKIVSSEATPLDEEDEETAEEEADEEDMESTEEEDRSLTSSPVVPHIAKLQSDPADSYSARSTKSLDRRDFDHSKVRSAPSSFMMKPTSANDARTILLKAQALQANLKLPDPGERAKLNRKGKSKSMTLLDQIDDDLPPPPEPPPIEYVSDVEVKIDDHLKKKKQKKDKKRKSQIQNQ